MFGDPLNGLIPSVSTGVTKVSARVARSWSGLQEVLS